jgi:predicted nucleotidyltransferase
MADPLVHLNASERECLGRFIEQVRAAIGDNLREVWLFGSFARGDAWWQGAQMHSDIDLLLLTYAAVASATIDDLLNDTYPLFLECGRQISPQFRVWSEFHAPADEKGRVVKERIAQEGRRLWPAP